MSLVGLNYYALVWAFVGALIALTQAERMARWKALGHVMLSMFVGALLGTSAGDFMNISQRSAVAVMSLLGGVGWQGMIAILLKISEGKLKLFLPKGGDDK